MILVSTYILTDAIIFMQLGGHENKTKQETQNRQGDLLLNQPDVEKVRGMGVGDSHLLI